MTGLVFDAREYPTASRLRPMIVAMRFRASYMPPGPERDALNRSIRIAQELYARLPKPHPGCYWCGLPVREGVCDGCGDQSASGAV